MKIIISFPASIRFLLVFLAVFPVLPGWVPEADARNSFWISARDPQSCIVSAVIQYDSKVEAGIRGEYGIVNPVILMDIHTRDPRFLCKMLRFTQGEVLWWPLLCVTEIRGNIYRGYLVLPEAFTLNKPIQFHLGNRSVTVLFVP